MTTNISNDQLVERYLHLEQQRAAIVEEQDAIKGQLRAALPVGKHAGPTGTVTVSVNRRFDPALAERVVGDNKELLAAITVARVDSATAKKILAPVVYEACMKQVGDPRVVIQ